MGMIKIKEVRLKASSLTSFEYLPHNPNSKYLTIQVKFGGKLINFDFKKETEVHQVIDYLEQKLPDFLRITPNKWIKSSTIKRYEVMPDFFRVKINGEESSIKLDDPVKFNEFVEFLDRSLL